MTKSATEVMHDAIYAAVIDAVVALRGASGGLPNALLRDLNAIHANTTLADLPKDVQTAIAASARSAFTRLQREGYSVTSNSAPPPRPVPPRADRGPRPPSRKPGGEPGRDNRGPRPPAPRGPRRPKSG